MKKKCYDCGKDPVEGHDWSECPSCGETLCPTCRQNRDKERREIERLKEGDAYTRLQVLCPSCQAYMNIM